MPTDTLQIDHTLLEQLQQDPRYAYTVEDDKPSVFSELMTALGEWLGEVFDLDSDLLRPLMYSFFTLVLIILAWWLVRSGLFLRLFGTTHRVGTIDIEEAEENIHSVDFDAEIGRAVATGNYTLAARLLYLQTLKQLSNDARIDWQPQKTPTQYTREERSEAFRQLTHHFLRIRYGGFEADEELFATMRALRDEVQKGGAA